MLDEFEADFVRLADRLKTLIDNNGTRVVFANIPDVTDIAFLVDRAGAEATSTKTVTDRWRVGRSSASSRLSCYTLGLSGDLTEI